jgi:hypothetical protein
MLKSFIGWLDDYLTGNGPPAIVKGSLGILSFAGLMGALIGSSAIRSGIVLAAALTLSSLVLLLLTDRRSLKLRNELHRRLVSHYCDFIVERLDPSPQVISWRQVTTISPRGDTQEEVVIRAKTLTDHLQFFRLRIGPGWDQPQKYRRRIAVNVRSLSVVDVPGTRLDITSSWLPNGKLDILAHFHTPPRSGSEIRLTMDWTWPGKCIPLMVHKEPDSFVFDFTQPVVHAIQKIILPAGYDAYHEPIGFREKEPGFSVEKSIGDQRQVQFVFEAHQLDANHKVGVRLELTRRYAILA